MITSDLPRTDRGTLDFVEIGSMFVDEYAKHDPDMKVYGILKAIHAVGFDAGVESVKLK